MPDENFEIPRGKRCVVAVKTFFYPVVQDTTNSKTWFWHEKKKKRRSVTRFFKTNVIDNSTEYYSAIMGSSLNFNPRFISVDKQTRVKTIIYYLRAILFNRRVWNILWYTIVAWKLSFYVDLRVFSFLFNACTFYFIFAKVVTILRR